MKSFGRFPTLFLVCYLLFPSSQLLAQGSILFMPSFIYISEQEESDGDKSEDTALYLNANLGLMLNANIGVAGKYFARIKSFAISADENGSSQKGSNDLSSFGVGLLYDSKSGPYLGGFYLHEPQKKQGQDSASVTYEGGYGYFVEAAYKIKAGSVELGPMISYAHLVYEKRETDQLTEELEGTWADTLILPFFGLWFYF